MQQQAVLLSCSTEANITAWDLTTATQLTQYKSNCSGKNRFCTVGSDYIAAAQTGKDVIHFWAWHKDQVLQRSFVQEGVTALAASPNGAYLVAGGASGTLYCWDTATGQLLATWPAHYKAVSALVFSDTGELLISAGEDTLVRAWLLAEVLDAQHDLHLRDTGTAAHVEPLHTWSEHTLPVTSLYLGIGEDSALLVTASLDRSIKLWAVSTGKQLRALTLPAGVTAATLDAGEHVLLAGCVDGSIWEVSLVGQTTAAPAAGPAAAAAGSSAGIVGGPGSCCFEGHTKAVSSLAVTPDGEQLVSGSEDGSARVWDLRSRQCLRVINSPNKAPVTSALLVTWPAYLGGLSQQQGSSGARQGPKRQQPLAQLAKYTGAAGTLKPWEGSPVILDGTSSTWPNGRAAAPPAAGLLPPPISNALLVLQQLSATAGYFPARQQGTVGLAAAAAANMDVDAVANDEVAHEQGEEISKLQQTVQQLQQQLQEARDVAQQWQQLHGELHKFCTENVLAAGGSA